MAAGWVVQHVNMTAAITDCNNNPIANSNNLATFQKNYKQSGDVGFYERWQVWQNPNNQWVIGPVPTQMNDNFQTTNENSCTKGTITLTGKLKFIPMAQSTNQSRNGGNWENIITGPFGPNANYNQLYRYANWDGYNQLGGNVVDHVMSVQYSCGCKTTDCTTAVLTVGGVSTKISSPQGCTVGGSFVP
jgi:hypothetical protein